MFYPKANGNHSDNARQNEVDPINCSCVNHLPFILSSPLSYIKWKTHTRHGSIFEEKVS